jgi:hypothetical protein
MKHKIFDSNGNLIEVEGDIDEILDVPYNIKRLKKFNIHHQLDCLYNDIDAGLFGEAAKTGQFYEYVNSIKLNYPKN